LQVYFSFNGKCQEALDFYKHCFNGEIVSIKKCSEAPKEMQEQMKNMDKNQILHSEFKAGNISFMASDCMGNNQYTIGNNISMSLNLNNETEQTKIFDKLASGGKVVMPLADTFWGAKFGVLEDRFGIKWMLSVQKQAS